MFKNDISNSLTILHQVHSVLNVRNVVFKHFSLGKIPILESNSFKKGKTFNRSN